MPGERMGRMLGSLSTEKSSRKRSVPQACVSLVPAQQGPGSLCGPRPRPPPRGRWHLWGGPQTRVPTGFTPVWLSFQTPGWIQHLRNTRGLLGVTVSCRRRWGPGTAVSSKRLRLARASLVTGQSSRLRGLSQEAMQTRVQIICSAFYIEALWSFTLLVAEMHTGSLTLFLVWPQCF